MITRDINFFAPYVKEQEKSTPQLVLTATAAVVMVGISGTLGYNLFQISAAKTGIETVTDDIAAILPEHKKAEFVLSEKAVYEGFNKTLMTVHDGIVDRSIIEKKLIDDINRSIPTAMSFDSFTLVDGVLTVNVIAQDAKHIADLMYNLEQLPVVKKVSTDGYDTTYGAIEEFTGAVICTLEEGYYEN